MDLCSYYTAFEVEKLRTVNYIFGLIAPRLNGGNVFCPGVTFCSSKQSLKLYEPPIDKQHKYEQNLKRIIRQSLVDIELSIARPSDLFLMIVYTVNYIVTILRMLMTWRRNERVIICYCIKPFAFNPEHPHLNTRNIDFLRKWLV